MQKAVAFDEAVFDQIRQAEAESGQKLRPGAYFKILDKDGNGVLERGESDAVDELFQTSGGHWHSYLFQNVHVTEPVVEQIL
eukprot:SAG31_NODE_735_length_12488_cov_7.086044_4_plen_82_part_00